MIHYSERILELLILDSPQVADQREAILAHLKECAGCAELHQEINDFYKALSGPGALPEHEADANSALRITPSFDRSVRTSDRPDRMPVSRWMAQNRRSVTSVGSFLLAGAIMVFFAIQAGMPVAVANHAIFDDSRHSVLIADKSGNILFTIPVPPELSPSSLKTVNRTRTVLFEDLDNDRVPEVIVWIPKNTEGRTDSHLLRVYRSDGTLYWQRELGEKLTSGGADFPNIYSIKGVLPVRVAGDEHPSIIVGAAHVHSPFILYRLSADGDMIGQYRTMGHIMQFIVKDIDGNGTPEIVVAGALGETVQQRELYVGVLDPAAIRATAQATFTPEPGFHAPPSRSEIAIAKLPRSPLRRFEDLVYATIGSVTARQDGSITVDVLGRIKTTGRQTHLEYVFSGPLEPVQVNAADGMQLAYAELHEENGVPQTLTRGMLDELRGSIKFWDGEEWRSEWVTLRTTSREGP